MEPLRPKGLRDTNAGIGHRQFEVAIAVFFSVEHHPHYHLAPLGELDRSAEQMDQRLANAHRIPSQSVGYVGIDQQHQLQPLCVGDGGQQGDRLLEQEMRVKGGQGEGDVCNARQF